MDENSSVSSRSPVDVAHFALFAFGFFFGSGGVILNSLWATLVGLGCILLSLLYFLVGG